MSTLLEKQNKLQKEALELVNKIGLREILEPYGQFELTGSTDYGLMTWKDIDANLLTAKTPTDEDYWSIVNKLFTLKGTKLLLLADNRDQSTEANRPKSMYVGIKYLSDGNEWRFDVRLLARKDVTTDEVKELIHENIDESTRQTILEIKSQIHNDPRYHKDFSSVDIYEAVLLHNVKNLSEFQNYLLKTKNVRA
ncbi:hypothetical protein GF389_05505 [Candidatus Dojkabacteria bacterium]|nr:hypothetical protein [Candidatus Dojkabacteria bacterium]